MSIYTFDKEAVFEMWAEEYFEEGLLQGKREGFEELILSMLRNGRSAEEVAEFCDCPADEIRQIEKMEFKKICDEGEKSNQMLNPSRVKDADSKAVDYSDEHGVLKDVIEQNREELIHIATDEFLMIDECDTWTSMHFNKGLEHGRKEGREELIRRIWNNGKNVEEIADFCNCPLDEIRAVEKQMSVTA